MADVKVIHLRVALPDPGDFCHCSEIPRDCEFWSAEWGMCGLGFETPMRHVDDDGVVMYSRPQACRDAEVGRG